MKRTWRILGILLLIFTNHILLANTIIRDDGTIYLGQVKDVNAEKTVIASFGKETTIPTSRLEKNLPTHDQIAQISINIVLGDHSVISGKINDFDEDIGLLLNTGFGQITIPANSIQEIYIPRQKTAYHGYNFTFGGNLGYYSVIGDLSGAFEPSLRISGYGEFKTPYRGWFAGLNLAYLYANYSLEKNVEYSILSLKPYVLYSFLDFKKTAYFLSRVSPFVFLQGGIASVSMKDNRENAIVAADDTILPAYAMGSGSDFRVSEHLNIRTLFQYEILFQKSIHFQDITIEAGVNYGI